MDFEKTLAQRVTDILIENGCTVNKHAVARIVEFFCIRETTLAESYKKVMLQHHNRILQQIELESDAVLEELRRSGYNHEASTSEKGLGV